MKKLLFLSLALFLYFTGTESATCKCGQEAAKTRVIGGRNAQAHRYPWMVYLVITKTDGTSTSCGGSLINDRYVLTAAHCTYPMPKTIQIIFGAHDMRNLTKAAGVWAANVINHREYTPTAFTPINDISLIRLTQTVPLNSPITKTVCLWTQQNGFDNLFLTGWGRTDLKTNKPAEILQEIDFPVVSDNDCRRGTMELSKINLKLKLCAGVKGHSACQGDSGGPLHTRVGGIVHQVGLVSHATDNNCLDQRQGFVSYTRISGYYKWIMDNTRDALYCD